MMDNSVKMFQLQGLTQLYRLLWPFDYGLYCLPELCFSLVEFFLDGRVWCKLSFYKPFSSQL